MAGRLVPEKNPEITGAFEVRDRSDVLRVLRRMVDRRATVALYDAGGQVVRALAETLSASGLTLQLEPDQNDSPVLLADQITLVSLVDDVKVQGEIRGPLATHPPGVLHLTFPTVLVRLQRRNGFRVRIPRAEPAFLYTSDQKYPVLDLSVRGVGLEPIGALPIVGAVWSGCRLRLGLQVLPATVVVRFTDRDRIGCAFQSLAVRIEQELGRRVMELDRLWMRGR
jgi:hypothetical protein